MVSRPPFVDPVEHRQPCRSLIGRLLPVLPDGAVDRRSPRDLLDLPALRGSRVAGGSFVGFGDLLAELADLVNRQNAELAELVVAGVAPSTPSTSQHRDPPGIEPFDCEDQHLQSVSG